MPYQKIEGFGEEIYPCSSLPELRACLMFFKKSFLRDKDKLILKKEEVLG